MGTKETTRSTASQPAQRQGQAAVPAVRGSDPFEALQHEVERVFDRFNGFRTWPAILSRPWPALFDDQYFVPSLEVIESDTAIEIAAELPGMDEKDIEISVADGSLTIRGEKKFERDDKQKNYRLVERSYGSFERTLAMPPGVETSKIKAKLNRGVLKVEIPKSAAAKAQQVKIATD
jgi:HSP20 family protein